MLLPSFFPGKVCLRVGALALLWAIVVALPGCASMRLSLGIPKAFHVRSEGKPELEKRVTEHIKAFLARSEFRDRELAFDGDVVVRTVSVETKDRLGVPYWKERSQGRVGGITLFTGKQLPVVIAVATIDGKWDERTLRHECAHVILLWNNINGHPRQFRSLVPLWY